MANEIVKLGASDVARRGRSFLSRTEGKVGAVVTVPAVVAAGVGLYYILPPLIVLFTNLIYFGALCGGSALVAYLLFNHRARMFASYLYRSFWRWVTNLFIPIDPIGILESYKEDAAESLEKMSEFIGTLRGQDDQLGQVIQRKVADKEHALKLASEARKRVDAGRDQEGSASDVLKIQGNQMGRLDKTLSRYGEMKAKIEQMLRVLDKRYRYTKLVFDDLTLDIENRKEERKVIQASWGAWSQSLKILRGDPDARALYDQTNEYLDDDYAEKMGQIKQGVLDMGGAIASMDLEEGVFQSEALRQLDEWEAQSQTLLSNAEQHALSPARPALSVVATPASEFGDILKRK